MMTDCSDTVETPVLRRDRKKKKEEERQRACLKAACFPGFARCTKDEEMNL